MIKIYMNDKKWRIAVEQEVWEFEDKTKRDEVLKNLLDLKDTHGRLKNE